MRLHEDNTLFRQAVRFTADQLNIPAIYVEKDYWVTYALFSIFKHEIGNDTVFKGGTALSKCYNIIERFSEDIDLVVLRRQGESNTRLSHKIKTISEVVNGVLPEVNIDTLTQKKGMNRKTAHTYARQFEGNYGQVRDVIVVESSWLGYFEPFTKKTTSSFVGNMMLNAGQQQLAESNGLLPFELQVLEPVRTICEKIMSLVRFSYGENPLADLKQKVRHIYDLHQLLQKQKYSDFFDSDAFPKMLLKVASDDVASYRNNNKWLANHPNEAVIFKDLENMWNEMKVVYNEDFRNLVYGSLPGDGDVLHSLLRIKERLATITWTIEPFN